MMNISKRCCRLIWRPRLLKCQKLTAVNMFNLNKSKTSSIVILCLTILYLLCVYCFYQVWLVVTEESYFPFEPEVTSDFPTSGKEIPIIPHIIHQNYGREFVPHVYSRYVQSFVDLNPTWQYYFWTDKSTRQFLIKKYPRLLPVWDRLKKSTNKRHADVLRYAVLYEYGGVYADLEFECLRPLDRLTHKYSCIIPTEPFEYSFLRVNQTFIMNNGLMMTRPKHPFVKQLMNNLVNYKPQTSDPRESSAMYVMSQLIIYNKINKTLFHEKMCQPYHNFQIDLLTKGVVPESHMNAAYVPNSQYFSDTKEFVDSTLYKKCEQFQQLSFIQKRACLALKKPRYSSEFAFTKLHLPDKKQTPSVLKQFSRWFYKDRKDPDVNIFYLAPRSRIFNHNLS